MQRRTNLFYTTGQDSNFITFSNYAEGLTGNFLATDWKMFPSKFICLYIPAIDEPVAEGQETNKATFIKKIVAYYENKLAYLRDYCVNNNIKVEENMHMLDWLLHYILDVTKDPAHPELDPEIAFIGEVTEHNYNGTYADTICSIDGTFKPQKYTIATQSETDLIEYEELDQNHLYGWYVFNETTETFDPTCITEYANVAPLFDISTTENYYNLKGYYTQITEEAKTSNQIKFNVIIPLFDLVNINADTNTNNIVEETETDDADHVIVLKFEDNITKNIPLGIWFADTDVVIEKDTETGYAPTWSLVLSSQFKPFPYSDTLTDECGKSIPNEAFGTFAQILARQNSMINTFTQVNTDIAKIYEKIGTVEGRVGSLATTYTIDGIKRDLINYERKINNVIDLNTDAAQTSISELTANVGDLKTRIDDIEERMTDTIEIDTNGVYNVSNYGTAIVAVTNGSGASNISVTDVYVANLHYKNGTPEYEDENVYGRARNIYFSINGDKSSIWSAKDSAYLALYKYRGRRQQKLPNTIGEIGNKFAVSQRRYCLQNDVTINNKALTAYCWVGKPEEDTASMSSCYFYYSLDKNNEEDMYAGTSLLYVHRDTVNDGNFDKKYITENNYISSLNNLSNETITFSGSLPAGTYMVRAKQYDISNYVNVIQNVDKTELVSKKEIIEKIIARSVTTRKDTSSVERKCYNGYVDDFKIVPTSLSECGILVETKLNELTTNKLNYTIGDIVPLSELTKEQFMNDTLFPNVILVAPWNTYHILMRFYKKDNCSLKERKLLRGFGQLKNRAKGGTTNKSGEILTLPLGFSILTQDEILHNRRSTSPILYRKITVYGKSDGATKPKYDYSGEQKLV